MKARYQDRNALAATAAESYFKMYSYQIEYSKRRGSRRERDTHQALLALGSSPSPDDVDDVMGCDFWTTMTCCGCEKKITSGIVVGREIDFESRTACLCEDCLADAVKAFGEKRVVGKER